LFVNEMIFAWVSSFMALALISEKLWFWLPVTLPGIFLTHSRASILILGAALLWKLRNPWLIIAALIIIGATVSLRPETIAARLELWQYIIDRLTVFGHGIGSTQNLVAGFSYAGSGRPNYAHNDALQFASEYGYIALFLLAAFFISILARTKCGTACVPFALFVLCISDHPLQIPTTAFFIALVTGYYSRVRCDDGDLGVDGRRHFTSWVANKRWC
jgi:O-antigen ligase